MMRKILFVLLLCLTSLLTACAGALLGNNGRPQVNESRQQRSIEQITADAMITSDIKSHYANDVVLNKLNISTYRGVVTLYGDVPTQHVMQRAIRLAQTVKGVRQVRSELRLR